MGNRIVNLNTKELIALKKDLKAFQKRLPKVADTVARRSTTQGRKYAASLYQAYKPDQTIDMGTISVDRQDFENEHKIIASGEEVLYAEFGTGDEGLYDPHPAKESFPLNPYNSGPTIKTDSNGRHYWYYNGVSYGNPSGKQMWQTLTELRDNIVPQILNEEVGEEISKL